ncbi:hypothetical protein RESH_03986 [Rhodopirellula europaea SH398]|uniref:Uncharacterized protein n=1 Tax=Rhodopirellula europaea SH398 TaxID=1263868 RepID=M5S211_9BACT|nr:hypothetical protein RESH_03986 [Rhodopirellula europaea SH398]
MSTSQIEKSSPRTESTGDGGLRSKADQTFISTDSKATIRRGDPNRSQTKPPTASHFLTASH